MILQGELIEGIFRKRLNRFEALVEIDNIPQLTHVPNTGRLRELLVDGATVLVRRYYSEKRKTAYSLLLVLKDGIWVSIDSANVPNRIVHDALLSGSIEEFRGYTNIQREVAQGNSRFDFGLFSLESICYIEVKGVTLVEDGVARFPDAPTIRGTRHLIELTHLRQSGINAAVIFIIQREDARIIGPNDMTDTNFGDALRNAADAGVELLAYRCKVSPSEIKIDCRVPVITRL